MLRGLSPMKPTSSVTHSCKTACFWCFLSQVCNVSILICLLPPSEINNTIYQSFLELPRLQYRQLFHLFKKFVFFYYHFQLPNSHSISHHFRLSLYFNLNLPLFTFPPCYLACFLHLLEGWWINSLSWTELEFFS